MFYCSPCGNERGWPTRYTSVSRGACELCGTDGIQHDVASQFLTAKVDRSPEGQDAEERLDRNDESAAPKGFAQNGEAA